MTDLNLAQTLIVGHLWQSVALAAVLAAVLIFGRRMQGSTRYSLAGVAFLASLALPLSALVPGETLATAVMDRLGAPRTEGPVGPASPSLVEQAIEDAGAPPWAVAVGKTAIAAARPEGMPAAEAFWAREAIADGAPPWAINLGAAVVDAATQPRSAAPEPQPLFTLTEFRLPNWNLPDLTLPLAMVWLAGTLMLLVRTGRDLIAVERLVARARPADLPEKLQRRMAGVRVAVSPDAPGPMAAGLLRPCIVLPETISLASPGMAALLEHERAHIERNDMAVALAQRIVLALLWWSPALHWMSRRIDEEREVACDEAAVHSTGDAKAFARSLTLQAQNQLWARAPRLAVGAIGPRSQVGRRVRRLIDLAKGVSPAKYSGRLAFAGLALAVAVAAMVTPRFSADAQQAPQEDNQPIDLLSQESRDRARAGADARANAQADATLDGGADFERDQDFANLGEEIGRLMETLGPELEVALQGMSPELQAELAALSTEMAALGAELSVAVSQEVLQQMPQIMEEVRLALEAEGIAMDDWGDFQDLSEEDREEIREAMEEAREEIRQALGPEMQAEIREALEEARIELAEHREEIRAAFDEQRAGLGIAREAMAAARAEIEAARARGDFDRLQDFHFDFDLDEEIIQKLREKNIDIDNARAIRIRSDESTPAWKLMRAAARCNEAEVRRLITEEKADVNAVHRGDGTALIAAARRGCTNAARALLNAGADPNLASTGDGNPLIAAASRGHIEVARLLLNRGADVNAYVKGDETPLMAAAEHDELAIAKLLVDEGANVNLAYNVERGWGAGNRTELRSPLNMAQRHGNDAVAAYLRSKGAVETPEPAN